MTVPVLVLPGDRAVASLRSVPLPWLMSVTDIVRPNGRYRTAHELYELIHGEFSALSIALGEAEAAVLSEVNRPTAEKESV